MKSCLIVDDSKVIRMVARTILEELDFEVLEATDAEVAVDTCTKRMPDAILLDWNLQAMTGLDFLRQLRGMSGGKAPEVEFCTTENDPGHIERAFSTGAGEYILKPFDSKIVQLKFSQVDLI